MYDQHHDPAQNLQPTSAMFDDALTISLHGSDTARCGAFGLEVKSARGSVIGKLCRLMVAEGIDPHTLVKVTREDTLCFHPQTIAKWAKMAVEECPSRTIHWKRWKAFNGAGQG